MKQSLGDFDIPMVIGSNGNIYVASGYSDVLISELNGNLTGLLASKLLRGSSRDHALSMTIGSDGNIFVVGWTESTDFPITSGTYDTSLNGLSDVFISKLDGDLTNLIASTYLGGYSYDYARSITLNSSGDIYITGQTQSSDFPTTTGAYDTSSNGGDVFVSKLNGELTSLIASTYLRVGAYGNAKCSLAIDSGGNIYVTGVTSASNFPTTTDAYDTSFNGGEGCDDAFVSKFDSALSASPPTATTGAATDVSFISATLNGMVNPNNSEANAWFQYGTASSSYSNISSTQSVSGYGNITVSIGISGLSSGTTYYYRVVAQNIAGTAYGSKTFFTTTQDTSLPTGSLTINEGDTYTKSNMVILSLSATDAVGVTGYYISTSPTTPPTSASGWTSVTSTTSYTADVPYTLNSGDGNKTAYAWYKDEAGNVSSTASDSIILDTTAPTITITSPTPNDTYTTTNSTIALGGTASDSTSGVISVTWNNDKGGSGTASGTTSWLTSSIALMLGENIITVTATDRVGNTGTDKITVIFTTATTTPTQTPKATVAPTPVECDDAEEIAADPTTLKLKPRSSDEVTVAATGEDGCPVAGDTVKTKINSAGKELISVSPKSQTTDSNGQAAFTITAKNKTGKAKVKFKSKNLKAKIKVEVIK